MKLFIVFIVRIFHFIISSVSRCKTKIRTRIKIEKAFGKTVFKKKKSMK